MVEQLFLGERDIPMHAIQNRFCYREEGREKMRVLEKQDRGVAFVS